MIPPVVPAAEEDYIEVKFHRCAHRDSGRGEILGGKDRLEEFGCVLATCVGVRGSRERVDGGNIAE